MSALLDLIFPRLCAGCGRPGRYLCPVCQSKLTSKSIIYHSSDRLEAQLSLFRYHGAIKQLISDFKYNFVTDLVPELSQIMYQQLTDFYPNIVSYWHQNFFTIVPVPLHTHRFNWRGFNQSGLLGKAIAQKLKLSFSSTLLLRSSNTIPQVKIHNKLTRKTNISSFYLSNSSLIPHNIILFDDVYTTGSTINSAAATFPNYTSLWALSLAG